MCGIIGFVGTEPCANHLLNGLTILENRGYDSVGMATLGQDGLRVTKFASKDTTSDAIDRLRAETPNDTNATGIAHTRWATHGGKTDQNAHPHTDAKNRIAIVHNGVIENATVLKQQLIAKNIPFRSETDTEVIAQLIGLGLDEGMDLDRAIRYALSQLEGTWGLAILSVDHPGQIIAAKNGSPIVIGIGQDRMFVASEPAAFASQTKDYIALNNGEIATIKPSGHSLDLSRVEKAPNEHIALSPAPFPHWTIKEIMEQPEAISRALNFGGRILDDTRVKLGGLEQQTDILTNIRHLVIAACGTSYHAALYGARLMRSLNAFDTVQVIDAAEITEDIFSPAHAGLLVISQSGETKDVHRSVTLAQTHNIPVFSVINAVGSLIARTTKCGIYVNAGREHAVASTKAFTTQVTVLALIATWFAERRDADAQKRMHVIDSLHRLSTNIGMTLRTQEDMQRVAKNLETAQHMFVLGKGYAEPIAREGALKIKEITYLHAEGYPGGALKHGPFALIEPGTPIILTILDDEHAHFMRTAAEEVRARGAYTIVITDNSALAEGVSDDTIIIPSNGLLTALTATVPMQLLAYELAVLRDINPDKPRNLAKAVTVD